MTFWLLELVQLCEALNLQVSGKWFDLLRIRYRDLGWEMSWESAIEQNSRSLCEIFLCFDLWPWCETCERGSPLDMKKDAFA